MDIFLFETINGLLGTNPIMDKIAWFFAFPLAYILTGILVTALVWPKIIGLQKRSPIILALAAALFARFAVKNLIVFFYDRPRPFDVLEITELIPHESLGSFPSGHAIFFFTLATTLFLFDRKLGFLLFTGAILISLSRVYAGIHWPSDILAGASLGILVGVSAFVFSQKFFSKTD